MTPLDLCHEELHGSHDQRHNHAEPKAREGKHDIPYREGLGLTQANLGSWLLSKYFVLNAVLKLLEEVVVEDVQVFRVVLCGNSIALNNCPMCCPRVKLKRIPVPGQYTECHTKMEILSVWGHFCVIGHKLRVIPFTVPHST